MSRPGSDILRCPVAQASGAVTVVEYVSIPVGITFLPLWPETTPPLAAERRLYRSHRTASRGDVGRGDSGRVNCSRVDVARSTVALTHQAAL